MTTSTAHFLYLYIDPSKLQTVMYLLQIMVQQRRLLYIHAIRIRMWRRTILVPQERRKIQLLNGELLRIGNRISTGLSSFEKRCV